MSDLKTDAIQKNESSDEENCLLEKFNYEIILASDENSGYIQDDKESPNFNNGQDNKESQEIIPNLIKILYSLPAFSKMGSLIILNVHALIFYESKGSSLLLISFFTALARCIEMILKPLLAHWSDNSKYRLGRRKPFMLFGCGFYALFLVILFSPPASLTSPVTISIWFGVFYVLFFLADAFCNIPYLALGPELSNDTKEREKLYVIFFISQYVGVLFTSIAPVLILYFINSCDCARCDDILSPIEKENCIENCKASCSVKNNQNSFLYMCLFVGLFFVFSIIILSNKVKEQKESFNKDEKNYYVPTLLRMMNNKPFLKLLVPWILDITVVQIFATISPFFITYIINPQKYCLENNFDLNSSYCNSTIWLGVTIFSTSVVCILSMIFFWHWIVTKLGKKKSWQIYSLMSMVTCCLFLFCKEGMMAGMLVFSMINAFPAGGAYLNEVLLTDVIDYDEFTCGKRNEGIYEVFSNFTPKIVGIIAQSIPLTILSLIGFVPSVDGKISEQPSVAIEFIRFYFIAIPILISFISFLLKMSYPIEDEYMMNKLKNAIVIQNLKVSELKKKDLDYYKIVNPIFNYEQVQIFLKNEIHKNSKIVADHFDDIEYIDLLIKSEYQIIKSRLKCILIWLIVLLSIFTIVLLFTFKFLEKSKFSLIPLFSLFIINFVLFFLIINIIKYKVINKVISGEYELDSDFFLLCLYKLKKSKHNQREKVGLIYEFGKLFDEFRR